jgi:hypothetical protein
MFFASVIRAYVVFFPSKGYHYWSCFYSEFGFESGQGSPFFKET